jgi:hypothetical protein
VVAVDDVVTAQDAVKSAQGGSLVLCDAGEHMVSRAEAAA